MTGVQPLDEPLRALVTVAWDPEWDAPEGRVLNVNLAHCR